MRWITGILINAVLFMAISGFFSDSFYISGLGAAIGASFLLSILNILVRPFLIILTLPVTILSLGLFLFVINAITLLLADSLMGSSFEIDGFWMALFVVVIMSLANIIIQKTIFNSSKR
ncbi:phage holin family protein [Bacillus aquiflavi]|uniref:Phage holin family protein n=1 Tax=Bacillus aquiflavi TaxID=2672567 RepID=A0A6B3VUW8_9BACI|nr:phage holin family protein [Bacillus aquiflavi]MBA4537552.1 phage holin family protein [Bacillus aquiflavi]NEY81809.1 phage holin family protein [Bacillus aquiflavi]UAC47831.1 phage holin family protein [Bacillus aquiflavi]